MHAYWVVNEDDSSQLPLMVRMNKKPKQEKGYSTDKPVYVAVSRERKRTIARYLVAQMQVAQAHFAGLSWDLMM